MADVDRETLLKLTPDQYLRDGFLGPDGKPRGELRGLWASAVCTQLEKRKASPQEVCATFEAFRQELPLHEGTPQERFYRTRLDAQETVASMYNLTNNQGILEWLEACDEFINTEEDLAAFVEHFQAVMRQYSVIIKLKSLQPS
jgi:hypothetical protein